MRTLKVEKEFLNSLTSREKQMMNNGFSITDLVWGRFNEEKLYVKNANEFNDYYINIINYADILDHQKDYNRSTAVNIQRTFIETSGLDFSALSDGKYRYKRAADAIFYGGPISIISKYILKKKVSADFVHRLFCKMENFLPNRILPFRYLNGEELFELLRRMQIQWQRDPAYYGALADLMSNHDFSKDEDMLIKKGFIKVRPKDKPLLTPKDIMDDPNFE